MTGLAHPALWLRRGKQAGPHSSRVTSALLLSQEGPWKASYRRTVAGPGAAGWRGALDPSALCGSSKPSQLVAVQPLLKCSSNGQLFSATHVMITGLLRSLSAPGRQAAPCFHSGCGG